MPKDRLGLVLTTRSKAAAVAYRGTMDQLLSAWPGALEGFDAAIAADPGFALGYIARARVLQMQSRMAEARASASLASETLHGASAREVAHVGILAQLLEGDAPGATHAAEQHLAKYPRDTLILALLIGAFALYASSGRADRDRARVDLCHGVATHYADDW